MPRRQAYVPVLIKNLDSGVIHAGFKQGHRDVTHCGTLLDDGESEILVYEGPRSAATCKLCRR